LSIVANGILEIKGKMGKRGHASIPRKRNGGFSGLGWKPSRSKALFSLGKPQSNRAAVQTKRPGFPCLALKSGWAEMETEKEPSSFLMYIKKG
jgi:hypothetical protein